MIEAYRYLHIFNKSIDKRVIYCEPADFKRMIELVDYYQFSGHALPFSDYIRRKNRKISPTVRREVTIHAYCIMPDHFHIILSENYLNGVSVFAANVLDSYTRYFNIKHNRKGTLWIRSTKYVAILNGNQFMYTTRYVHRNPVRAKLVSYPLEWAFSSVHEYCNTSCSSLCTFNDLISCGPDEYKKYVNSPDGE